jgi:putative ABC transport system permease protein
MRPALHLAINSLVKTRNRVMLLALAMAVATSLTVAVASVMGTMTINLQLALGQFVGLTDLRIVQAYSGRFDQAVLDQFKALPEVRVAAAQFNSGTTLYNPATKQRHTLMILGVQPGPDRDLRPIELSEGRWLTGPGEVVIDGITQRKTGATLGGTLQLQRISGKPIELTVVGIIPRSQLGIIQRPGAMMDLTQVQELAGFDRQVDEIGLRFAEGVTSEAFEAKYKSILPQGVTFQNSAGATAGVNRAIHALRLALLLLTLLVFLCASFIVLTSLTTDVAQRTRELAILRCVGATRMQVASSQILIGLAISALGALVGTPIGLWLSYLLYSQNASWLKAGFSTGGANLTIAIAGSAFAGLVGSLYPAWQAASVSPLEALAARARVTRPRAVLICLVMALACLAFAATIVYSPGIETELRFKLYASLGLPALLIGAFLLSVPLIVTVTKALGRLVEFLLRIPRGLVTQNIAASPYRFGFTSGALMVSLAMLVALWTGGRSLISGWLDNMQMPDGFAHSYYSLTKEQWQALRTTPGVTLACPTTMFPIAAPSRAAFDLGGISSTQTSFVSFDPESFFQLAPLEFVQGNQEDAIKRLNQGNAILVSREYLNAHKIGVGSQLTFKTNAGPTTFDVVGVVASPGLDLAVSFFGIQRIYSDASVSCIFGSRADAKKYFGVDATNLVLMKFDPNTPDATILDNIRQRVPGVIPGSARRIRSEILRAVDHAMGIMSTIALVALTIACIGVGNLIIAGLATRRFELGVLRAMGATRFLLARLVIAETLLVAITGCLLGSALGVVLALFGRVFHQLLLGITYQPMIAWDAMAWGSLAIAAAAILAAIPAILSLVRTPTRAMIASE